MENIHCDELDNILNSKLHFLERYGIFLVIAILSALCMAGFCIEHVEKIDASSLSNIAANNSIKYKLQLNNRDVAMSLVRHIFILNAGNNGIACEGLSIMSNDESNVVSLVLQPICITDTTDLRYISLYCTNDDLSIEIHQSYFQIVISPMLSLFNKD